MCRRSRAPRATASSCASKPTTRDSIAMRRRCSLKACTRWESPKLRRSLLTRAVALVTLTVAIAGCRQDMHDAPRYDPLEASTFFADGRGSRALVANTVARGTLREDLHLYQGKVN